MSVCLSFRNHACAWDVPERERLCILAAAAAALLSEAAFFAVAILAAGFEIPACAEEDMRYMYNAG